MTVGVLCNHFLTAKEQQRDAGEIRPTTFDDYHATCKYVVRSFGKTRFVDDLAADDFQALRARRAKRYGPHTLSREVQQIRTLFKYGYDAGLIDRPVRFGPLFKRPSKRVLRAHRQKNGLRMFEADVLRRLLDKAGNPLKAMILLGINCGFGNTDCAKLPKSAVDLARGWVNFPRPKTGIERRCPLWPETIKALKDAMAKRPRSRCREDSGLVFLTKYGQRWVKDDSYDNPVTKEFRKLMADVDKAAAKAAKKRRVKPPESIHRPGLGFYALRHTFETIAGESKDQVAVNHIMGHSDESMAAFYRERIGDDRLVEVVNLVHRWLFVQKEKIG
jgi:integrase